MTKHQNNHLRHLLRAAAATVLAAALNACASAPATVPAAQQAAIKRVGIVSLVGNEMHAYFKVGPVLRERVGASVRETFLGPPVLGKWRIDRGLAAAAAKALSPRYTHVPLDYDPAKLSKKAYQSDPDRINLSAILPDLRHIDGGRVDIILVLSTSGSMTRVVGRKVWLHGYGIYRQSILPGAPTVDYVALSLTALDAKSLQPIAARSVFTTRHLPASMWNINVTAINPKERQALRDHISTLLKQTVAQLIQEIGLGEKRGG